LIAREVGHHVQNLLGILANVERQKLAMGNREEANRLQVRLELQADCFAGIWANRAQQKLNFLEPGDVEAALRTAAALGDDRGQHQSPGYVAPDAFTHGTSEQRQRWFANGLMGGKVSNCNTFGSASL
jgi:predicted metalloprotease